jgi:hypothetical protein
MAKLIDHNPGGQMPIGTDALLRFIDDINVIRARSGQRRRFRPHQRKDDGVVEMVEYDEVMRPADAKRPSPRYSDNERMTGQR